MNTTTSARGWPWGLIALGLSVLYMRRVEDRLVDVL